MVWRRKGVSSHLRALDTLGASEVHEREFGRDAAALRLTAVLRTLQHPHA
jgi:hypothetical protein